MSRILESYGFLTGKVEQLLELDLIEKLAPYDINARQYGVLIKINEKPNLSQKEIANELKIDRTTMVDFIDHFESLQYVIRIKNPKDRRSYCIQITNKGQEVLENCWGMLTQSEMKILSPLTEEEQFFLKTCLLKILKNTEVC
ncbi:DNA-binding transcriptional regulator, MarR family [Bacillus sp. 491mf]|uniref:MarR family winged helix-turn-helix transcriptional regulator n=1 Tax=Bacillus sp. 491mf TaxID=1761755 RepID=UPI0008E71B9A|nr:MarR family transcriptional regulator [Bacillus sp. 491mf]SFD04534.1 DNA-binding transcriptional regulator, MarR family [Bacillus sp. 491mf]